MNADYLFHEGSGEGNEAGADIETGNSLDLGDCSLQCGRRVDGLKLWFSWQALGDQGFERRVDHLFELAEGVRGEIRRRDGFRLIREQQGTNICFRYLPVADRKLTGEERMRSEHKATVDIRERLARAGTFLVNYATVDGASTFRLVTSNPATSPDDLIALLDAIEQADQTAS